MKVLMHYNPHLEHQCEHAYAFIKGSDEILVTIEPHGEADVHIISGNWFAYQQWKDHPRTLMIDRAWWGDGDDDPKISIGWLQPDGSRRFASGDAPRPKPDTYEWKDRWQFFGELRCLVLADYNQDVTETAQAAAKRFNTVNVRRHPENEKSVIPLRDDIAWHDVVIGHSSTALVEAVLCGVPVICTDPTNEVMPVATTMDGELFRGDRSEWLHDMSYKQFSLSEIADGTAWDLLRDIV